MIFCQDLDEANTDHNRAYFCSKIRPMSERHFSQDLLASFGSLMKNFMPQFVNVNSVLRARIPIVKFKHSLADIEGDLCAGNMWVCQFIFAVFFRFHIA